MATIDLSQPPAPIAVEAWGYEAILAERKATLRAAGSYRFHARSADGRVADVAAVSPSAANVTLTVLSRDGGGTASPELLQVVRDALNDEDVRPVAGRVIVQSAKIAPYVIEAVLYKYPGPELTPSLDTANKRLRAYVQNRRRLGRSIRRSSKNAALAVEGVEYVEIIKPAADIVLDKTLAGYCTRANMTQGRADD